MAYDAGRGKTAVTRWDAVIIGGGLAGCMAAITLAQSGKQVALIEAGDYPRNKVCGEFFSPECTALFDSIGFLPVLNRLAANPIRTIRITAPDGEAWQTTLRIPGLSVSRYTLDAALAAYAQQVGVELLTRTRALDIDGDLARGFSVTAQSDGSTWDLRATGVIAAHGKRSNLDRVLKRRFFTQQHPYIGLKRYFIGTPLPGQLDLHVFPGGYCGVSQVENGQTNVCLLVEQPVFQAACVAITEERSPRERFIRWMCQHNPQLGAWMVTAVPAMPDWLSIGQVALCPKTPLEGDVLMAGDAAGMVAPLAGDGMAMALHSGRLAAEALTQFLTGDQSAEGMKRAYAKTWTQQFRFRLRLGRTLHNVLIRPRILSLGLRTLRRFPAAGDWLIRNTRDLDLLERNA